MVILCLARLPSNVLNPVRNLHQLRGLSVSAFQNYSMSSKEEDRPSVYITRPDIPAAAFNLLQPSCDVEVWNEPCPVPRDVLIRNIKGKDALLCTLCDKIDSDTLDAAGSNLKVISTMSVGYDHIDIKSCKMRNIKIGYTPDVLTDATAELTMALLLATIRRVVEANKEVCNGGWKAWAPTWMCGKGLKGAVVGLVGFGRIGQEVAKRIVPFKPAEILYNGRTERKIEAAEVGAQYVAFEELLRRSDVVIALCALTPQTTNLFNQDAFCQMKKTAVFINVSRGAVVDQKALISALKAGDIRSAGLDVTTPEPLPLDDPLLTLPNVVILPHIGSAEIDTRDEMSRVAALNIIRALKGENLIAEVQCP